MTALTRRALLAGSAAGLLGLAACGSGGAKAATGKRFAWTDARGKELDLASRPTHVVAQSSAAASLLDAGYPVKGVYGELGTTGGKLNYQAGRLDLAKLTVIGKTYGEFAMEKFASVQPDLLIDMCWDGKTLWYVPANDLKQVESLSPTLGIRSVGYDLEQIIGEFVKLAAALGADTGGSDIRKAKAAYQKATAQLTKAVDPKLRVLVMSGDEKTAYLTDPRQSPDLAQLTKLGVRLVDVKAPGNDTFLQVSWERIADYPADVILFDARVPQPTAATWKDLPAVRAGQAHAWHPAAPFSYRAYAPIYSTIAGWLSAARVL